jgi:hypothetical protein
MTHPKTVIKCPIFEHVRKAALQCSTGPELRGEVQKTTSFGEMTKISLHNTNDSTNLGLSDSLR